LGCDLARGPRLGLAGLTVSALLLLAGATPASALDSADQPTKSSPPPTATYDLTVTIEPANSLEFDVDDSGWLAGLDWRVTVANRGPESSPATTLTIRLPDLASDPDCGQARLVRMSVSCPVPGLAPGDSYQTSVAGEVFGSDLRSGTLAGATASVPCGSPQESACSDDSASGSASIAFAPHVRLHRLDGPRPALRPLKLTGSAAPAGPPASRSAVARVEVAVLRLARGSCRWLNRRGGFTATPADRGSCDRPVWLHARGTHRWRYVIAHGLAAGRYAAYGRATSASGAADQSFSAQRRNAITIVAH
jgi:hypothetical protein